jgi:transposase
VDPQTWLADVLDRIITGKVTAKEMETLFPWVWKAERDRQIANQGRLAA